MAEKLNNILGLFREGRTRVILLATIAILLIAVIVGLISLRSRMAGEDSSSGVSEAPGNIRSIPFNAPTEEYAKLQEKQNEELAKQAEETGSSAIPTIVRAKDEPVDENPSANVGDLTSGLGFSSLGRLQSDSNDFTPKELNLGSDGKKNNCPIPTRTPIYDSTGCLIGYVAADGVAQLGAQKLPKEPENQGVPVYDKNGRLIGMVGPDGKVRDAFGNIIGTVGPDGVVRDANGNIIGQAGAIVPGTPVYDENGQLIGFVGPDGKVRDATGRIVGTVGADGVVRDASGKPIGKLGTPVYDANGKLIGYAGADGKVRDVNGNVIGVVGPDGTVRDINGNVIGKAGAISPGSPIYDAQGRIIGYVGPDGKVRDANGNVIGMVGPDGIVKDANGNIIGSIHQPPSSAAQQQPSPSDAANPALPSSPLADATPGVSTRATDLELAQQRQRQILNDQRLQQLLQQKQQAMANQANQLLVAWASPVQQLVAGNLQTEDQAQQSRDSKDASSSTGPVFIKAGSIVFAVLNTQINSDEPGPVMATIVGGDYKGGKLLGTLTNQGKAVMLTFNTLTLPNYSKSIGINAVAIDQNTARTGLTTYTDNHYWMRYGSVFAAAFIQGYGQAVQQANTSTTQGTFSTQTSGNADMSPKDKVSVALGNVGTQLSSQLNTVFNTPPTVHVASGTGVGILFLGDVQMPTS